MCIYPKNVHQPWPLALNENTVLTHAVARNAQVAAGRARTASRKVHSKSNVSGDPDRALSSLLSPRRGSERGTMGRMRPKTQALAGL